LWTRRQEHLALFDQHSEHPHSTGETSTNVHISGEFQMVHGGLHEVMKILGEPVVENTEIRGIDVTTERAWKCGCQIAAEKRLAASMTFYDPCPNHERRRVPRPG
jgi:hypothetical protein